MLRRAARVVAHHPVEDVDKLLAVVLRAHDTVEVVTAHAVEQRFLLLVGAGETHEPFGVRHLLGEVLGRRKLDLDAFVLSGRDVGASGIFEVVADGADAQRVLTGLKPAGREAEAALVVGRDAGGDGRADLLGADHHAFHQAFLGGGYGARQRGVLRRRCGGNQNGEQDKTRDERHALHDRLPSRIGRGCRAGLVISSSIGRGEGPPQRQGRSSRGLHRGK